MKRRWEVWLGGEVRGRTFGARDSIESRRNLSRRRLNPSGNHWCRSRERWQVARPMRALTEGTKP